jgi:large subunit ribosomal protein L30
MLNLERVNNAVFIDDRESYRGMLQIAKDYITWGEVDREDVSTILKNRGKLIGNKKLTDAYMKGNTKFKSIDDFSKSFLEFKTELSDVPGLKTVFKLHPPRKGYGGIKRAFSLGGALGYRDTKIKELIIKMR